MKLFIKILLTLIVFFKSGNLLSENNLLNVNNILLEKKDNISNNQLADLAIQKGFTQLINKILLNQDISKLSSLNLSNIKQLVSFYNISNSSKKDNYVNFSITFDKDKIHNLLYKKKISYSDISDKEFFILPILIRNNEIFVFSNNYFYENWNKSKKNNLIEFLLPLENIEIIQNINKSRSNLLDLNLSNLFREYKNKNVALIIIEEKDSIEKKIYLKARIQNKKISKSLNFKNNVDYLQSNEKVINQIKKEIINLVKSQNLIDVQTPSFLNVKLNSNDKNNLFLLNSKIKNVDLVESIYVQRFNKNYIDLKIKYFGKLEKIIYQLKKESIQLQLINEEWFIKSL